MGHMPVMPALWVAEAGGLQIGVLPGECSKTLSQSLKKASKQAKQSKALAIQVGGRVGVRAPTREGVSASSRPMAWEERVGVGKGVGDRQPPPPSAAARLSAVAMHAPRRALAPGVLLTLALGQALALGERDFLRFLGLDAAPPPRQPQPVPRVLQKIAREREAAADAGLARAPCTVAELGAPGDALRALPDRGGCGRGRAGQREPGSGGDRASLLS